VDSLVATTPVKLNAPQNNGKEVRNGGSSKSDREVKGEAGGASMLSLFMALGAVLMSMVSKLLSAAGPEGMTVLVCTVIAVSMTTCELSDLSCGILLPLRRMHDGYWPLIGHGLVVSGQAVLSFSSSEALLNIFAAGSGLAMTITAIDLLGSEEQDWSAGPTSLPFSILYAVQAGMVAFGVFGSLGGNKLSTQETALAAGSLAMSLAMVGCAVTFLEPNSIQTSLSGSMCRRMTMQTLHGPSRDLSLHVGGLALQILLMFEPASWFEVSVASLSMLCAEFMTAGAVLLLGEAAGRDEALVSMAHMALAFTQASVLGMWYCRSLLGLDSSQPAPKDALKAAQEGEKDKQFGTLERVTLAVLGGGVSAWMTHAAFRLLA